MGAHSGLSIIHLARQDIDLGVCRGLILGLPIAKRDVALDGYCPPVALKLSYY